MVTTTSSTTAPDISHMQNNLQWISQTLQTLGQLCQIQTIESNHKTSPYLNQEHNALISDLMKYIETSDIALPNTKASKIDTAVQLRHYANLYIVAGQLQMLPLQAKALKCWWSIANVCLLGTISMSSLLELVQHVLRNTRHDDTGIRTAALRLAASYRQKYESVSFNCFKGEKVPTLEDYLDQEVRSGMHRYLIEQKGPLDVLNGYLDSQERVAWNMAKCYEVELDTLY